MPAALAPRQFAGNTTSLAATFRDLKPRSITAEGVRNAASSHQPYRYLFPAAHPSSIRAAPSLTAEKVSTRTSRSRRRQVTARSAYPWASKVSGPLRVAFRGLRCKCRVCDSSGPAMQRAWEQTRVRCRRIRATEASMPNLDGESPAALPFDICDCVQWARRVARRRVPARDLDDCVQEAVLRVLQRVSIGAAHVVDWRPYVCAVARNVCSERSRPRLWHEATRDMDQLPASGAAWAARRTVLLRLVWEASTSLGGRDQLVLREVLRASTMAEVWRNTGLAPVQVKRAIVSAARTIRRIARSMGPDQKKCSPPDSL